MVTVKVSSVELSLALIVLIGWIIITLSVFISSILVFYGRFKQQNIRARAPILIIFSSVGSCLQLFSFVISYLFGIFGRLPCGLITTAATVGFVCTWLPYMLRAWRLYYVYSWNTREMRQMIKQRKRMEKNHKDQKRAQEKNQAKQKKIITVDEQESPATQEKTSKKNKKTRNSSGICNGIPTLENISAGSQDETKTKSSVSAKKRRQSTESEGSGSESDKDIEMVDMNIADIKQTNDTQKRTKSLSHRRSTRYISSSKPELREPIKKGDLIIHEVVIPVGEEEAGEIEEVGMPNLMSNWSEQVFQHITSMSKDVNKKRAEEINLVKVFLVMLVLFCICVVPFCLTSPKDAPNGFQCESTIVKFYDDSTRKFPVWLLSMNLFVTAMFLVEVIMLIKVKDSYLMNWEIRGVFALSLLGNIPIIALKFIPVPAFYVIVSFVWMFCLQVLSLHIPAILVVIHIIKRILARARGEDFLKEENETEIPTTIDGILKNKESRELFKNFLAKSLCSESVLFYEDVISFKGASKDQNLNIAQHIFETYLKQNSMNEINIPGRTKRRINQEMNAHKESIEGLPQTLFDDAIRDLKIVLNENGTFGGFIKSKDYTSWAEKIQIKIKENKIEEAGGLH